MSLGRTERVDCMAMVRVDAKKSVDRTHTIWLILSTQLKFSSRHPSSYFNFYHIFEYLRKTGLKYRVEKLKGHTSDRPKRMKQ